MSEFGEGMEGVIAVVELLRPEPSESTHSERQRRARAWGDRIVTALRIYVPAAILGILGAEAKAWGPAVEAYMAPVRTDQRIHDVLRTGQDLCWTWTSYKARALVSDNIDVFVDIVGLPGAVAAPWERDSRMPWVSKMALPAGHVHDQHWCVTLPPYAPPGTPVRVRQTAWYPGLFGLWHVAVHIPDVVDPAGSVIP